jgi:hypothetical protein
MPAATRIPLAELNKAVARAVAEVDNFGAPGEVGVFRSDFFRTPWWVVGRLIRESMDLNQAHELATQVSKTTAAALKIDLAPVVTAIDGDILVGFIERYEGAIAPPAGRLGGPSVP